MTEAHAELLREAALYLHGFECLARPDLDLIRRLAQAVAEVDYVEFHRGRAAGLRSAVLVVEHALRAVERNLEEKAQLHPDMERAEHRVTGGFIRASADVARDRLTAVAALERAAEAAAGEPKETL